MSDERAYRAIECASGWWAVCGKDDAIAIGGLEQVKADDLAERFNDAHLRGWSEGRIPMLELLLGVEQALLLTVSLYPMGDDTKEKLNRIRLFVKDRIGPVLPADQSLYCGNKDENCPGCPDCRTVPQ